MTLLDGMYSGIISGLGDGLNYNPHGATGPTLLADFNFATPATVGIGGNGTFASSYATDEWLLQETSGTYANNVGSETLTNTNGLQGQTATGLWDGSSYTARNAWEADDTVANDCSLVASGTTAGDSDSQDFALRFIMRAHDGPLTSGNYLVGKWDSGTGFYMSLSGGRLRVFIDDGTTSYSCPSAGADDDVDLFNGAWHEVSVFYDFSAQLLYINIPSLSGESSTSTTGLGSISGATALTLNEIPAAPTSGQASWQCTYLGVSVGANAQNFYNETVVLPGTDPSALLTTQSRASLISVPVSATAVAHFSDDTLPIGYNANFSDTNKLGLYCNSAVTNLVLDSEDLTAASWNKVTMTVAANQMDSPDGFRSAGTATATANNAVIWDAYSMSASTEYTFSCWVKRNGASNVAGKISIWDSVTGHTQQAFTATDTWQLVSVTATIDASQSVGRGYLWVDTNTESISFHMMQMNLGDARGAYIRTSGASAALVNAIYRANGSAGDYCKSSAGELEAVWCTSFPNTPTATAYLWDSGAAGADRMFAYAGSNGRNVNARQYDSSGSSTWFVGGATADRSVLENTTLVQWDSTGGLVVSAGAEASLVDNLTAPDNEVGTYTATDTAALFAVGNNYVGGGQIDGFIQRIRIWDGERS